VIRNQSTQEQHVTLLPKWVHRFLSSKMAPLRQIRAQLTISQMASEGIPIGNIIGGGTQFTVYFVRKPWPAKP
jgi:hypothetical protein